MKGSAVDLLLSTLAAARRAEGKFRLLNSCFYNEFIC